MKPTQQQIVDAAARLTCLAMFPTNPVAHKEIMRLLARMVPTVQALDWLVTAMIDRVGEWKGPAELRGLLCSAFKPADGIEANCTIVGFTPADSESLTLASDEACKAELVGPMGYEISKLADRKRIQ